MEALSLKISSLKLWTAEKWTNMTAVGPTYILESWEQLKTSNYTQINLRTLYEPNFSFTLHMLSTLFTKYYSQGPKNHQFGSFMIY